jgi:hypothetical protein
MNEPLVVIIILLVACCVIETLGKSLLKSDIDGLFSDVLRQVLSAVFRLQEDELSTDTMQDELQGKT